jgi:lipopolysaccharide/colanic/teichoic acid biosynthesis glycosyltransferase
MLSDTGQYQCLQVSSLPIPNTYGFDRLRVSWDLLSSIEWFLAVGFLFLSLPLVAIWSGWVFLVDPGSPFYCQTRVGLNGRLFTMYKLRTMKRESQPKGAAFCQEGDRRLLPGARLIRKLRIDEIPQFLNVLAGEMALVGPRPEQPAFVSQFAQTIPNYQLRHRVKPGITGLAQVRMGYVDDEHGTTRKLRYDLLFIRTRCFRSWLFIMLSTVRVVAGCMGR